MRQKTNILVVATSFIGGLATGLLLAPRKGSQNRAWVSDHATELADWADTQQQTAIHKSNLTVQTIRENIQEKLRKNIPNLFEATEDIPMSKRRLRSE